MHFGRILLPKGLKMQFRAHTQSAVYEVRTDPDSKRLCRADSWRYSTPLWRHRKPVVSTFLSLHAGRAFSANTQICIVHSHSYVTHSLTAVLRQQTTARRCDATSHNILVVQKTVALLKLRITGWWEIIDIHGMFKSFTPTQCAQHLWNIQSIDQKLVIKFMSVRDELASRSSLTGDMGSPSLWRDIFWASLQNTRAGFTGAPWQQGARRNPEHFP